MLSFAFIRLNAQDTIFKRNGEIIYAKVSEINPEEVKFRKFNFNDGPLYIERKTDIKTIRFANGLKEEFSETVVRTSPTDNPQVVYYVDERSMPQLQVRNPNRIEPIGNKYLYQHRQIGENELYDVLLRSKDKHIISLVGKAKDCRTLQFIGFGAIPLGIGALYFLTKSSYQSSYYYGGYGSSPRNNDGDLALSAVCVLGAITCEVGSGIFKQKRKAANREAVALYNEKY
jgi:hypothetical protein